MGQWDNFKELMTANNAWRVIFVYFFYNFILTIEPMYLSKCPSGWWLHFLNIFFFKKSLWHPWLLLCCSCHPHCGHVINQAWMVPLPWGPFPPHLCLCCQSQETLLHHYSPAHVPVSSYVHKWQAHESHQHILPKSYTPSPSASFMIGMIMSTTESRSSRWANFVGSPSSCAPSLATPWHLIKYRLPLLPYPLSLCGLTGACYVGLVLTILFIFKTLQENMCNFCKHSSLHHRPWSCSRTTVPKRPAVSLNMLTSSMFTAAKLSLRSALASFLEYWLLRAQWSSVTSLHPSQGQLGQIIVHVFYFEFRGKRLFHVVAELVVLGQFWQISFTLE